MKSQVVQKLKKLSQDSYNEIAAEFDATRKKYLWPEINKFSKNVNEGQKVLDAGCGNGRLLEALQDKKIEYLGIDNSTALLEKARLNYPDYNFLEVDLSDNNNLKMTGILDKQFDFIFCIAVLQHIPSFKLRVETLKNFKQMLAPGGEIIISNWNLWSSRKRNLIIKQFFKKIIGLNKLDFGDLIFPWKSGDGKEISNRYYHAFGHVELKRLSRKAGFKRIIVKKDPHNYWLILKN